MKLILRYVALLRMMTNDPLNLARYGGRPPLSQPIAVAYCVCFHTTPKERKKDKKTQKTAIMGRFELICSCVHLFSRSQKYFQRGPRLMFIIILMKSKKNPNSSQKRGGKTARLNTTTTTTIKASIFSPFSLSFFPPLACFRRIFHMKCGMCCFGFFFGH